MRSSIENARDDWTAGGYAQLVTAKESPQATRLLASAAPPRVAPSSGARQDGLVLHALFLAFVQQDASSDAGVPTVALGSEELVVRDWLGLAAVDERGRRPLRPDAVLARHLIEPDAPPPRVGELVSGEKGQQAWKACSAGEDGMVGDVAWAYARVTSQSPRVVLARLSGANTLFVNGVPHQGDPYGYGFGGTPVALVAGANDLYVTGLRGAFRLTLAPEPETLVLGTWDLTVPTLVVDEESPCLLGVRVLNASFSPAHARLELVDDENRVIGRSTATLAPLEVRQIALASDAPLLPAEPGVLPLVLRLTSDEGPLARVLAEQRTPGLHPLRWGSETTASLLLAVRAAGTLAVRTFRSRIDASVQKFALLPPAGVLEPSTPMRLLLSLHGAGVDCEGQAASYAAKPDFWIAAPTNRRPFGFDWQDWGREDAYEVLDQALALSGVPRERVVLSGHSMGGHGTWSLAAIDPDGFAAIAPSAGWRSFDTYGSRPTSPEAPLRALWHAADGASCTEDWLANLAPLPIYVLHGEADDNVPASEGHAMLEALAALSAAPQSHFEPGAGHWWDDASGAPGAACVDWPGFFELFRSAEIPGEPREIDWSGIDLSLDAHHHWVGVDELLEYGRPFRVRARVDGDRGRLVVATENVRVLALEPVAGMRTVELDGVELELGPSPARFLFEGSWRSAPAPDLTAKSPARCGPLKRAFDRGFVLVVPTKGTAPENRAALERARHDQAQWSYRANGDAPIVTDAGYLADAALAGRDVILYGNETTNAAFVRVVPEDFPLRVARGEVRLGAERWSEPGLGALAVGPLRDDPRALFAILGSVDPPADRISACLSLFVSGAGFPDYLVFGRDVLARGDGGVRAAGFFDSRWRVSTEPVRARR